MRSHVCKQGPAQGFAWVQTTDAPTAGKGLTGNVLPGPPVAHGPCSSDIHAPLMAGGVPLSPLPQSYMTEECLISSPQVHPHKFSWKIFSSHSFLTLIFSGFLYLDFPRAFDLSCPYFIDNAESSLLQYILLGNRPWGLRALVLNKSTNSYEKWREGPHWRQSS